MISPAVESIMVTERLSERLQAVAELAGDLPPEAQDQLAEQIATALENALWDAQLRDPAHLDVLRALADEARSGPKLPMPTPRDTGDETAVDPETLAAPTPDVPAE
jgi:hypothetical protein